MYEHTWPDGSPVPIIKLCYLLILPYYLAFPFLSASVLPVFFIPTNITNGEFGIKTRQSGSLFKCYVVTSHKVEHITQLTKPKFLEDLLLGLTFHRMLAVHQMWYLDNTKTTISLIIRAIRSDAKKLEVNLTECSCCNNWEQQGVSQSQERHQEPGSREYFSGIQPWIGLIGRIINVGGEAVFNHLGWK